MVDYQYLPPAPELVERFNEWQAEYDDSSPVGPNELDWDQFSRNAEGRARDLKRCVHRRVYVGWNELVEALLDGTTRSCRPALGLPEICQGSNEGTGGQPP